MTPSLPLLFKFVLALFAAFQLYTFVTKSDEIKMVKGKATATVQGRKLAEADEYEVVEGNVYFPPSSLNMDMLTKTSHSTHCPWKGDASYYTINLDKTEFKNAAWYYATPSDKAKQIKDYVAFYKNIVDVKTE